jgi:CubicO group peptidase (beta-lactamase class C family)
MYASSTGQSAFETEIETLLRGHSNVPGLSLTVIDQFKPHPLSFGQARVAKNEAMTNDHFVQCASLSKTVAAAFAIEYFSARNIPMTTSTNSLLERYQSTWKIEVSPASSLPQSAADQVTLAMLVNHTALGMHYVYGIPIDRDVMPKTVQLLEGTAGKDLKYDRLYLERQPGTTFSYSGGGFVVLQYLMELMEKSSIDKITRNFLDRVGLEDFTFSELSAPLNTKFATGHVTPTKEVFPHLAFPAFAAGGLCTTNALARFLIHLGRAYSDKTGSGGICHETAQLMLGEASLVDLGCINFMGAKVRIFFLLLRLVFNVLCFLLLFIFFFPFVRWV